MDNWPIFVASHWLVANINCQNTILGASFYSPTRANPVFNHHCGPINSNCCHHPTTPGTTAKNKTPGGGTVRGKDFADFKIDVDRKFKGLDRKLDELLNFLTSSNTMGSVTPGDTASLSGASSATSSTSRTATTINKTLKP